MYRKGSQGWIKHYDFVLFDLFALQFAYLIAYFIRNGAGNPYGIPLYRNMAVAIELADIAVLFFFETLKNVLKRGYYRELAVTVKHQRRELSIEGIRNNGRFEAHFRGLGVRL